jgi:glycosyltransferase involved in cell wall biosynthesis
LATKVVCVSPYLIERSITDGLTKKSKMILLNRGSCNGVDALGTFNPDNLNKARVKGSRDKLGIPEGHFVIGYVGRLVKDKGIVELVDSFMNIVKQRPNVLLLLVGPEETRDSISLETKKIIKEDPRIIATGAVEKNIEYFYSLMDLLILPTHREGLGTTILEGSAMSKPVLTTAHTGSRDAMVDEVTGSYIQLDSCSIANKILKYIENPELCRERGLNGRRFVLDNFQQQLIWQEIENKLYKQ